MDSTLKQRLIGAAVLAALAIIFLPMLLKGPDVREPDAAEVPLSMPASPSQDFETRELPLTVPDAVPPGGAVGMAPGSTPPSTPEQPVPDSAVADVAPPAATDAADAVVSAPAPAAPATATPVAPVPVKPAVVEASLPSSEAARVGAGRHVVNVGTFANLANANALASKLRGAGLPVIAERVSLSSGTAMRLRVGPYATRTSAEAARLRADQATNTRSTVIVLDAPVAAGTPATKPTTAPAVAPAKAPTATATQVATPAPAPAVASSGFAVQLSAPSVEADAVALRDKARAAGFSSFVQRIETANGTRFRVRVGPVADRAAATTLRDEVNSKLGTGGIVVTNP
jgi:DedD protein